MLRISKNDIKKLLVLERGYIETKGDVELLKKFYSQIIQNHEIYYKIQVKLANFWLKVVILFLGILFGCFMLGLGDSNNIKRLSVICVALFCIVGIKTFFDFLFNRKAQFYILFSILLDNLNQNSINDLFSKGYYTDSYADVLYDKLNKGNSLCVIKNLRNS